jgi:hypothetical protein
VEIIFKTFTIFLGNKDQQILLRRFPSLNYLKERVNVRFSIKMTIKQADFTVKITFLFESETAAKKRESKKGERVHKTRICSVSCVQTTINIFSIINSTFFFLLN